MTETNPNATPTRSPSEWAIETLARSLARTFRLWRKTYPMASFTEEKIREICQRALCLLEGEEDAPF